MNTARGGAAPTPQKTEKNQNNPVNVLDVSNLKVAAVNPDAQPADPQAPREKKATPDYSVYLSTEAAESPLHGIYAVYPLRVPNGEHTTAKLPCGIDGQIKGGVYNFIHPAADVMKVLSSQARTKSVVASIRSYLIRTAKTKEDADYLRNVEITLCLGRVFFHRRWNHGS